MATPITEYSLENHTAEDIWISDCKLVHFDSCTSISGEENWITVTAKADLGHEDVVAAIEATRSVSYKQHDGVPGLELRRGCTRRDVSWIPIV